MRSARPSSLLLGLLLAAGAAAAAHAAEPPAPTWPQRLWNNKPAEGDLVLPMPCGGAMTFRRAKVPSAGVLDDYKITVGGRDEARAPIEHARTAYVSAPFADTKPASGTTTSEGIGGTMFSSNVSPAMPI